MPDQDYRHGGLRHKYHVTKADGTPTDPEACYFVLRVDSDPHARAAVRAYAESVELENPRLTDELRNWVEDPVPFEPSCTLEVAEPEMVVFGDELVLDPSEVDAIEFGERTSITLRSGAELYRYFDEAPRTIADLRLYFLGHAEL